MAVLCSDGFHGEKFAEVNIKIEVVRKAEINVTCSHVVTMCTEVITFDIINIQYLYNAIFRRNNIKKIVIVIHQSYLCMKIPTADGVLSIFRSQEEARRCEDNTSKTSKNVYAIEDNQEEFEGMTVTKALVASEGMKLAEHTKKVPLCEDIADCTVIIGKSLEQAEEERLIQFLKNKQDVFAWSMSDLKRSTYSMST